MDIPKGNNYIYIHHPQIADDGVGHTKLFADTVLQFDGETYNKTLFFEVENEWGKYLVSELSDAFVLALLELAMEKNCDIYYDVPMSETLKYQLEQYLIAVYARKIEGLHGIKLIGPTTRENIVSEKVAGTGFSGGVDSWYSTLSHVDSEYSSKKVTHLLLAVSGAALTGMSEELDQKWFQEELARFRPAVTELGLKLIGVNSNISLLNWHKKLLKGADVIVTSSFVHALRKLFATYYWASGHEADFLEFVNTDGCSMDSFTVPLVSVDGLRFYHSGCEVSRVEKVAYIADNAIVQKSLTVCGETTSCGHCSKCLRTMSELYSIKKLEAFRAVFDVDDYKEHFSTKLARELAMDQAPFTTDIIKSMKSNDIHIPISVYIKKNILFEPYYFLKKRLRNNKVLMKLYYQKGWSVRLGEGTKNEDVIKARLEEKGK